MGKDNSMYNGQYFQQMILEQLDIHIKREPVITYDIQKLTQTGP